MVKARSTKKRNIIIALVILIVLAGAGFAYAQTRNDSESKKDSNNKSQNDINFDPPTEQDKKDAEANKDRLVKEQQEIDNNNNSSGKKSVQPTISYVDRYVINAYVTGIFEENGTCTATLTNGGQTITKTSTGFGNASYTQCSPIELNDANLGNGIWTVKVNYSSATAEGNSEAKSLKL